MKDDEILKLVALNTPPGMSAASLAAQCNLSRQRCSDRLKRLAENGELQRAEVSSMQIYWDESVISQSEGATAQNP